MLYIYFLRNLILQKFYIICKYNYVRVPAPPETHNYVILLLLWNSALCIWIDNFMIFYMEGWRVICCKICIDFRCWNFTKRLIVFAARGMRWMLAGSVFEVRACYWWNSPKVVHGAPFCRTILLGDSTHFVKISAAIFTIWIMLLNRRIELQLIVWSWRCRLRCLLTTCYET